MILFSSPQPSPAGEEVFALLQRIVFTMQKSCVDTYALDEGVLQMPGDQSAHTLSPYYCDQLRDWAQGLPIDLLAGQPDHKPLLRLDDD